MSDERDSMISYQALRERFASSKDEHFANFVYDRLMTEIFQLRKERVEVAVIQQARIEALEEAQRRVKRWLEERCACLDPSFKECRYCVFGDSIFGKDLEMVEQEIKCYGKSDGGKHNFLVYGHELKSRQEHGWYIKNMIDCGDYLSVLWERNIGNILSKELVMDVDGLG